MTAPPQRPPPATFQVGGNVLGEARGAIDGGEVYEVHFVIDADDDGQFGTTGDYNCVWDNQAMPTPPPTPGVWDFTPPAPFMAACDANGFDPTTVSP